VFVISWVNPDERHWQKTFADYMLEGPVSAMMPSRPTGERAINLIGYCLGGTLTACLMSWLASTGRADRVKSVTYFTTMLDFTEPGELGLRRRGIRREHREAMEARGFLEGSDMAGTFNMLRDNDLIWSFVVNNYLLGKEPFPFDLLFWNSDSTRMPPQMHTFYLRNMYIRNLLTQPEALELCGEKIDLSLVDTPTYFISAMEDHIAPWKSTYAGAQALLRPRALRARRLGPHRRHRESAGRAEVLLLDQRCEVGQDHAGVARGMAGKGKAARWLVVDRLAEVDCRAEW
jgi:polyhydroxyalkanoate synthase